MTQPSRFTLQLILIIQSSGVCISNFIFSYVKHRIHYKLCLDQLLTWIRIRKAKPTFCTFEAGQNYLVQKYNYFHFLGESNVLYVSILRVETAMFILLTGFKNLLQILCPKAGFHTKVLYLGVFKCVPVTFCNYLLLNEQNNRAPKEAPVNFFLYFFLCFLNLPRLFNPAVLKTKWLLCVKQCRTMLLRSLITNFLQCLCFINQTTGATPLLSCIWWTFPVGSKAAI